MHIGRNVAVHPREGFLVFFFGNILKTNNSVLGKEMTLQVPASFALPLW